MTTGLRYRKVSSKASMVRSSISWGVAGARTTARVFPCPSPWQASFRSACSGPDVPEPGPACITFTNTPGSSAPIM